MSIFSADGTLLQIGKNPADNLPQISFDELADLKDADNKIDEAQVRKYQNKTDRPADPPWERTPRPRRPRQPQARRVAAAHTNH